MNEFDLNYQYELYLKRVKLDEKQMSAIQRQEMKRVFMGACGQMLILCRDEVTKHSEKEAITIFKNMLNQIGDFWLNETHKTN